jgi:superfamily I DNA/RNA helicase
VEALAAVRAALDLAVFTHEAVNDQQLEQAGIDPDEWRRLAIRCLLMSNALETAANTIHGWQIEAGKLINASLAQFKLSSKLRSGLAKLKPQQREGWDQPCSLYIPSSAHSSDIFRSIPVMTVHGVKGETHDVTVFVCPDTTPSRCPSAIWWSTDETDREEKRIAFVAMTRTSGDLIVCVSQSCYGRLLAKRPEFVSSFQSITVEEFVTRWSQLHPPLGNTALN